MLRERANAGPTMAQIASAKFAAVMILLFCSGLGCAGVALKID
jgi:hypothetical protein